MYRSAQGPFLPVHRSQIPLTSAATGSPDVLEGFSQVQALRERWEEWYAKAEVFLVRAVRRAKLAGLCIMQTKQGGTPLQRTYMRASLLRSIVVN